MKYPFLFISILLACNTSSNKDKHQAVETHQAKPSLPYDKMISKVIDFKIKCKDLTTAQSGIQFSSLIDSLIFPYWYGTPWDYNGVTQTPNDGYIACGYFVTTVLRDAGVQINRVKMAQCASEQMIKSLTNKIEHYPTISFNEFITKVKQRGIGLSVIGLDNHTGFLYNDGKELYFIHSSFVGTGRVIKELASTNSILMNSHYKVVGYISQDKNFIDRWLKP